MLIYNKDRVLPILDNVITLSTFEGAYIYAYKDVYNAAIILKDRYNDLKGLCDVLQPSRNQDAINFFFDKAPAPINFLAPFLGLINKEILLDLRDCCGYLHIASKVIDFIQVTRVSKEVRKSVEIYVTSSDEYDLAWMNLIQEWLPQEKVVTLLDNKYEVMDRMMKQLQNMPMMPMVPNYGGVPYTQVPAQVDKQSLEETYQPEVEIVDGKEMLSFDVSFWDDDDEDEITEEEISSEETSVSDVKVSLESEELPPKTMPKSLADLLKDSANK